MERTKYGRLRSPARDGLRAALPSCLLGWLLIWPPAPSAQQPAVVTTTVQDTVYTAEGTPASGTVVISWPAFTTAGGTAIPAGSTSTTIGANGQLDVALAPNAGGTPMGSYYTAIFHLSDGTTSRQFWVIPQTVTGGGPVKLADIQNQVLPTTVAMQTVSKQYVDAAIAKALTGQPADDPSEPYVLKAGDTMTGPLVLPGDPVSPTQAADKNYVDENVQGVAAGLGQKVSLVPSATQIVTQPSGTQLEVNLLNGELDAQTYQTLSGSNGLANALSSPDCATAGCELKIDHSYTGTDPVNAAQVPAYSHVIDARGGTDAHTFVDPLAPGNELSVGELVNHYTSRNAPNTLALRPSATGTSSLGMQVNENALGGGNNQFPGGYEVLPYAKSTYGAMGLNGNYNTQGQHVQFGNHVNCFAVGDCLAGSQYILSYGGYRDVADEGTHPYDLFVSEAGMTYTGTCQTGCTTGSTTVGIAATSSDGTEGDGRFLMDTAPSKTINTGSLIGGYVDTFQEGLFSGTNFPVSIFLMTAQAALSQPGNLAPGTVTLPIMTTGLPVPFAPNTAALPATSGIACVAETLANANNFPNFETAPYTVVDGTHIRLTLNKVHGSGAAIAVGGLCGYGLEQKADSTGALRQVFPVVGSFNPTGLFYAGALTGVVGSSGAVSTSAFQNISLPISSVQRSGGVVTVTTAQAMPYDLNGLTLTVSGVTDPSYNGSFAVTTTGQNTFTYASAGTDSTSSGGSIGILTGGYNLMPMAEVVSAYNPATKSVDGTLTLAPNNVPWAQGDPVEEPHFYQQQTFADTESISQFLPRPIIPFSAGKNYGGTLGPGASGWTITNSVAANTYLGGGGMHQPPDSAYVAVGVWRNSAELTAGTESVLRVHCNLHGCNRWNSGYALIGMDSSRGEDFVTYDPNASDIGINLAGTNYTFGIGGFTAPTINVGTLNATTVHGAAMGASGTAHAAGLVPDPGAIAGTSRYLREDGTWAVPAGTSGNSSSSTSNATPVTMAVCNSSYTLNFSGTGDIAYDLTLGGNCTLALDTPPSDGTYRRITVIIRPNGFQASFPSSSATLMWSGGITPTPSTTNLTLKNFCSTGVAPIFGGC